MFHEFHGWPMERDIRRNAAYSAISVRRRDPRLPYAWLIRAGVVSVPVIVLIRIVNSWRACLRCRDHYGIPWFEIPAILGLAAVVHAMEIGGMVDAFA